MYLSLIQYFEDFGMSNEADNKDSTEILLIQILQHVNDLHNDLGEFAKRIDNIEKDVKDIKGSFDKLLDEAFVDRDLTGHKNWHQNNKGGFFSIFKK